MTLRHKYRFTAGLVALSLVVPLFMAALSPQAAAQEATPVPSGGEGSGTGMPHVPENPYGVNLFLHKEVEAWKIEKTLQMVAEANIPWVKQQFPWQEIEFKKGYFYDDKWNKSAWEKFDNFVNLAEKYKLNLIARVGNAPEWALATDGSGPLKDNQDLADFIIALLDHYEGRLKYVQVWNEPNLAGEWVPGKPVDPAGFVEMMKTVYPAVKEAHPDAVIVSAPMAMTTEGVEDRGNMNEIDYWEALYEEGIKGLFDVASANGYGLDQPPDAEPDPEVLNFRRVELIREVMVENGDENVPIWFNEYAWNASPETLTEEEKNYWRNVTPEQQAEWTVEGINYARENWPWAGVVNIWYFRQVGDIPPEKAEYYFGMVTPEFETMPVYGAVKEAAAELPGPAREAVQETPVNPAPTDTPGAVEPTSTTAAEATPTSAPAATATQAVAEATPTPAPATVGGAEGSNTMLFVIGGLLVLAGLGGLGYYLMRSKGNTVTKE